MTWSQPGRWPAALALITCAAVAGCTGQPETAPSSTDKCAQRAEPAPAEGQQKTYGHLSLTIPAGWYPVDVCFEASGPQIPLGYLTTVAPISQCREHGNRGVGCGPPADLQQLGPKDVIVIISTSAFPIGPYPDRVAGRPARLPPEPATPPPAHYWINAEIKGKPQGTGNEIIYIRALVPASAEDGRQTVLDMLDTATYDR